MVLSWLGAGGKPASVTDLVARKKYDKALELLKAQFSSGNRDPRLRMQLADVLALAGRGKESVPILAGLADEYASEGFAAKAIAILKKIEKIDPGRKDVDKKLAALIQQEKPRTLTQRPSGGFDIGQSGGFELGMEAMDETAEPALALPDAAPAADAPLDFDLASDQPAPAGVPDRPPPVAEQAAAAAAEAALPEPAGAEDDAFDLSGELLDVIQEVLAQPPAAHTGQPEPGRSPLFSEFAEDELLAVMAGLRLLTFAPGDIIITEGEPGDSLFVLTTGVVKAFVRDPRGRHVQVRQMEEGAFFGEISILTGSPRTATVTAAAACELLELDRPTMDEIAREKPNVWKVLQQFHKQRAMSADEARIRNASGPDAPRS